MRFKKWDKFFDSRDNIKWILQIMAVKDWYYLTNCWGLTAITEEELIQNKLINHLKYPTE